MSINILSVDDETDLEVLLRQFFRQKIKSGEYRFTFTHNGLEALKLMLEQPGFDIVLSDINMPEMDGLSLLAKINEWRNPAMKCIMVSAYGDIRNIRMAMNGGAFDFATKPIDLDDLGRTIEKAKEQIIFVKESQKEHSQLTSIRNDLNAAGVIQQAILPSQFTPLAGFEGLDIFASMTPAREVGGDFYDFFPVDSKRTGFVIADVSGKGVPAALFMAVSRTLIRAVSIRSISTAQCLETVNELLCKESLNYMFVTVFYGITDRESGETEYSNAGHNPPYVIRSGGEISQLPASGNPMLGVFSGSSFGSGTLFLDKGDQLLLYTDGVTEAFNPEGEQYGEQRLEKTLSSAKASNAGELVDKILDSLSKFTGNAPQSDDITILAVGRIQG